MDWHSYSGGCRYIAMCDCSRVHGILCVLLDEKAPDLTKQTQEYTKAIADYNAIKDKFPAVQEEFERFKKEYAKLKEEYDILNVQCEHLRNYIETEEKFKAERAKHDN